MSRTDRNRFDRTRLRAVSTNALVFGLGMSAAAPSAQGAPARIVELMDELGHRDELAPMMADLAPEMQRKLAALYTLARGVVRQPARQDRPKAGTGAQRPVRVTLRDETGAGVDTELRTPPA